MGRVSAQGTQHGPSGKTRTTGRSEKKEVSVQPMSGFHRLLRARGRERPRAQRGPDVTGARPGQSPNKAPGNQQGTSRAVGSEQAPAQTCRAGNVVEVAVSHGCS